MKTRHSLRHTLMGVAGTTLLLPGLAAAGNLGVVGKISTLGYGIEADYILSDKFSLRGQYNTLSHDDTYEEDDIDYEGTLDLKSFGVLLDWHPFGGGFRLSAGGFHVDNEMRGFTDEEGVYEIGDATYTVDSNDSLEARALITLGDGFKPYLGLGWGHAPSNKGGLLLSFDIGILFQGDPEADLQVNGTATDESSGLTVDFSNDPTVQAEVQKEEDNLEDDLKGFDLYPVISFGVGWRF